MNRHLSSEEISNWMAGDRRAGQERHAWACPQCSAEIERLEKDFSLFRESGRRWADHRYVFRGARSEASRRSPRRGRLRFAVAAAAPVIAGIFLLRQQAPYRSPEHAFVRVPYVAPLAPYERTEVMRMEVPVAACRRIRSSRAGFRRGCQGRRLSGPGRPGSRDPAGSGISFKF